MGFVVNKVTLRQAFLPILVLRRGSRRKQILNDVQERRISRKLKEEALSGEEAVGLTQAGLRDALCSVVPAMLHTHSRTANVV